MKNETFYLAGGVYVKPVAYDKTSGEISYVIPDRSGIMTCLIADMNCVNDFPTMMEYLNKLPSHMVYLVSQQK